MSDQQDIWASIREKLSPEELMYLDNAIDKRISDWQEVQNNIKRVKTILGQAKENTLEIAAIQFSQEIEAHERELTDREEIDRLNAVVMKQAQRLMMLGAATTPQPSMYDRDGELERVEIISDDSHLVAYTNDSVKRFIEKRLLLAWTALKNADHLNDPAAPKLTINQTGNDSAMDIIGLCIEEIDALNAAAVNGDIVII